MFSCEYSQGIKQDIQVDQYLQTMDLSAVQIWKSIADWAGGAVAISYASWLNMTEATVKDNLA